MLFNVYTFILYIWLRSNEPEAVDGWGASQEAHHWSEREAEVSVRHGGS